ncbi:extracellular solute-binding protein [Phytoactinopolyspora alkaliphila]|uniref:Extracellular solute-binding protein n=1 Tax=Phytoactinopolyspora alkaliphila TaxID=1783498 RepID=A0A6N9YS64_9ACTN|nr:extracellular solute-binding protein [Phytoactinopolyspora alkaliphila]NED97795.1 extracellular solute-binding protein [Phytoactinopolyspora alkaliphila]
MGDAHYQGRSLNRRRFLQMGLGAAVVAAGCDDNGGGGPLGEGDERAATALTVPANESPWLPAYQDSAQAYEADAGGRITIREFPYDGLRTAMVNAIRGGNVPFDLFHMDEPWTGEFYDNEWVTPLTEIDSEFTLDENIITYDALPTWNAEQRRHADDGTVMGLPINGNINIFIYRQDLYDQLGLSVPTTFEEAYENGRIAQDSGEVRYGYVVRAQGTDSGQSISYDYMPVMRSYGADWYTEDWQAAVNSPEGVAAMEMFRQLVSLGPPQPQTVGQAEVIAAMQGGQALQIHVVAAAAPQLEDPSASRVAGQLGYTKLLAAESTGQSAPTSGVWSLAIPRELPDERARGAFEFITWLLSEEGQLEFTRSGGIPTRLEPYESDEIVADAPYLPAIRESLEDVRSSVRFPFSADMLPVAERALEAIAAGDVPVQEGLDDLADELSTIAGNAGFGG